MGLLSIYSSWYGCGPEYRVTSDVGGPQRETGGLLWFLMILPTLYIIDYLFDVALAVWDIADREYHVWKVADSLLVERDEDGDVVGCRGGSMTLAATTWITVTCNLVLQCTLDENPSAWLAGGEFMLRLAGMICLLPELFVLAKELYAPPGPRRSLRRIYKRWKRRKQRKREPWFGRAKRRAAAKDTRCAPTPTRQKEPVYQWNGTRAEWEEERQRDYAEEHPPDYASVFEYMLDSIPGFTSMFGAETFNLFSWNADGEVEPDDPIRYREAWGFLNIGEPLREPERSVSDTVRDTDFISLQSVYMSDADQIPIVFDTGATISVTPNRDDFISWETPTGELKLTGITQSAQVLGVGRVRWTIRDDNGRLRELETRAYYVPQARARLFSPQAYLKQRENQGANGCFRVDEHGCSFVFPNTDGLARLTFVMEARTLPIAYVMTPDGIETEPTGAFNVVLDNNFNLTYAQKELLQWHFRLGHFNLRWIQDLTRVREGAQEPVLPCKHRANTCDIPLCQACQHAKAHLQPDQTTVERPVEAREGVLRANHLRPGEVVSTDQFVSKVRGRLCDILMVACAS
jgi:hypothetical protein